MMKTHLMVVLVCLAACKDKPAEKKETQTFEEAMALICGAGDRPEVTNAPPAERQQAISTWLDEQLKNPEARKLFETVGGASPADAFRQLDEAARRAGIDLCALTQPSDPLARVQVPDVGALPLAPMPSNPVVVIATVDAIIVEGDAVLPLREHELDPAELEGGRGGRLIPKLQRYLSAIPRHGDEVALVLHPKTPYRVLFALAASVRSVVPKVTILARGDAGSGSLPLTIPDMAPSVPSEGPPPLGMIVALTTTKALVFSMDGTEGTIGKPLIETPSAGAPAAVRTALADVGARHTGERRIVLMADDGVAAQDVVTMIAAMRESFPDVLLSRGFE